eukprot:Sspe_Gene.77579::Locus_48482_Transcript_1_1_Confidence_1.000_Length_1385::g.77579::m.77579
MSHDEPVLPSPPRPRGVGIDVMDGAAMLEKLSQHVARETHRVPEVDDGDEKGRLVTLVAVVLEWVEGRGVATPQSFDPLDSDAPRVLWNTLEQAAQVSTERRARSELLEKSLSVSPQPNTVAKEMEDARQREQCLMGVIEDLTRQAEEAKSEIDELRRRERAMRDTLEELSRRMDEGKLREEVLQQELEGARRHESALVEMVESGARQQAPTADQLEESRRNEQVLLAIIEDLRQQRDAMKPATEIVEQLAESRRREGVLLDVIEGLKRDRHTDSLPKAYQRADLLSVSPPREPPSPFTSLRAMLSASPPTNAEVANMLNELVCTARLPCRSTGQETDRSTTPPPAKHNPPPASSDTAALSSRTPTRGTKGVFHLSNPRRTISPPHPYDPAPNLRYAYAVSPPKSLGPRQRPARARSQGRTKASPGRAGSRKGRATPRETEWL